MKKLIAIAFLGFAGYCSSAQTSFSVSFPTTVDTTTGNGQIITIMGTATNSSDSLPVIIKMSVISQSLPYDWSLRSCNPSGCTSSTTTTFTLAPSQTDSVGVEFNTGIHNMANGTATIRFSNASDTTDYTDQSFTLIYKPPVTSAIEEMQKVDTLVIDKTGTITKGKPSLKHVQSLNESVKEEDILALAASLEYNSEHPLAHAIVQGAEDQNIQRHQVDDFNSITGKGISGTIKGKEIAIGNKKLLELYDLQLEDHFYQDVEKRQLEGETVMFVVADKAIAGFISVADPIKPTSAEAIRQLQEQGLKVIMLTGDNKNTAKAVAEQLGLDGYEADLLPENKYAKVKTLQQEGKKVAMAGDGINDAPALAQADVGIAMGTGTDVAIESAGITLVKGELDGIVRARKLSTQVMRNIRQNLFFAFIYNTLGVPVAAGVLFPFFGILLSPMLAALAMSLSSVSVIMNSLRLRAK